MCARRRVHTQDKVDPLNAWKTAFDACTKQGKIRGADGKCNPLAAQCQVRAALRPPTNQP